jgi:predicted anti-sigma-YlaC factor YlaD
MHIFSEDVGGNGSALRAVLMSCRDTIHLICWYLEGKLSPTVSHDIEEHLHGCSNCQLVLKAATSTLDQYFEPVREDSVRHVA